MTNTDTSVTAPSPIQAQASVTKGGISEWAPWLVLLSLLVLGLVGGLGGLPLGGLAKSKGSVEAVPPQGELRGGQAAAAEPAPADALPPEFPTHLLARGVPLDPSGPKTIEARHVLVQYRGSWHAVASVTRPKEEAFGLAQQALEKLKKGEAFESVVLAYTDSADVRSRKGVLGLLDRETAMRAIAEPAFALKVGQYSEVVESPFGFHVIQRTK